jgi:hypothetical protein
VYIVDIEKDLAGNWPPAAALHRARLNKYITTTTTTQQASCCCINVSHNNNNKKSQEEEEEEAKANKVNKQRQGA